MNCICGNSIIEDDSPGVLHHAGDDGIDHELDADHVPIPEDAWPGALNEDSLSRDREER